MFSMPVDEVPATFQGKYDLRGAYSEVTVYHFHVSSIRLDKLTQTALLHEHGKKKHCILRLRVHIGIMVSVHN